MSAEDFLQRVEQTGLVSEPLLAEMRKRISQSTRRIRPEMLAKLLVDRGELTAAQARKLVSDANNPVPPPPPLSAPPEKHEPLSEFKLVSENDDLDFAPDEDDPFPRRRP